MFPLPATVPLCSGELRIVTVPGMKLHMRHVGELGWVPVAAPVGSLPALSIPCATIPRGCRARDVLIPSASLLVS